MREGDRADGLGWRQNRAVAKDSVSGRLHNELGFSFFFAYGFVSFYFCYLLFVICFFVLPFFCYLFFVILFFVFWYFLVFFGICFFVIRFLLFVVCYLVMVFVFFGLPDGSCRNREMGWEGGCSKCTLSSSVSRYVVGNSPLG